MRIGYPACAAMVAAALAAAPVAAQDVEAGKAKAQVCAACHGEGGSSANPKYPSLAGQTARYIYLQLKDFKEDRRTDPEMTPMAKTLERQDMYDVAAYFAAQTLRPADFEADPAKVSRGAAKSAETLCTMCHLGGLKGQNEIPRLAGQGYAYVVKQLQDFKAGRRTNDAGNMASVSKTLSDEDIEALGHYIASLQ